jgi:hypothetical protein
VERICGWDHKRIYGADFQERLHDAGFETAEITCTAEEITRYRVYNEYNAIQNGDRVFIAWRSDGKAAPEGAPGAH